MIKYLIIKTDHHIIEPNHSLYGIDTNGRSIAAIEAIARENVQIEMIVDLGDVADTIKNKNRDTAEASADSYNYAASLFTRLPAPTLHIPGNHDDPELMFELLGNRWNSRASGCYEFQFHNVTIIGVDCRTGPEPTAFLRRDTAAELDRRLSKCSAAIVVMHYPWIETGSPRIDLGLSITNRSELEVALLCHCPKISAIFHGHLHLWCLNSFHGIPVYGSAGTSFMFDLQPETAQREKPTPGPLGYYLVGVDESGTLHIRPRFVTFA